MHEVHAPALVDPKRFVQLAQAAGFSIDEIKSLLDHYDTDTGISGMWRSLAENKRQTVNAQIEDLHRMDIILEKLLTCECKTLEECVEIAFSRDAFADG